MWPLAVYRINGLAAVTRFLVSKCMGRLRVVSLSFSPSRETRKKPAKKNGMGVRDPGGEKHAKRRSRISSPSISRGHFFLAG